MLREIKPYLLIVSVILISIIIDACKTTKKPHSATSGAGSEPRLLVFIKTKGFYHESIPTGAAAMIELGKANHFRVDTTSDSKYFVEDSLKNYSAVMFLNTTMNVLNSDQQMAFERYIQAGGGFAGIHAAADTEYEWPWYNRLLGAFFSSHPKQQTATIQVSDTSHPSTRHLPSEWVRYDEWYDFKNVQPGINVIAWLDETSYEGGKMGREHPFAWYHEYDGGRSFYTAGGHTRESYSDTLFMKHVLGGINYAMENQAILDYSKSYAEKTPEDNRFTKTVLTNDLNEPMELAVAPDGKVFFTERSGKFYMYHPDTKKTLLLHTFPAKAVEKYLNGLIGITLDPDFTSNRHIYFFYSSSTGEAFHQNVSRFRISEEYTLDTLSEKIIIKIPIDLEVSAHTGGSLAWDKNRNLYISTGDNTVPFESDGYAPLDERKDRNIYDAQRSAANTNDLRGKILRIHPEADGSYTIPEGNLFPKGMPGTRPEIYIMGCRNPYRISVDPQTSVLYWGEVGPDAGSDSRHGPRGYDEFNQARKAGNFGWPYFVGNNIAYTDSNFATGEIGDLFNALLPVNNSPHSKGLQQLPPAEKPMIWYPYNRSDVFPVLGEGGRCAMGGPIYYFDSTLQSDSKLPAYYNKSVFLYDWMRNWVFAVRLDENDQFKRLEPFMPANGDFRRPVDMEIGPDGSIYMLEYGSVYGIDNVDARLVRIDYNAGNRMPVAKITVTDTVGNTPLKLSFNATKSYDYDEDDILKYEWFSNGQRVFTSSQGEITYDRNGIYSLVLKVTDPFGASSSDTAEIKVGNTLPLVSITTTDNSTFFFNKITSFNYNVNISDKEDELIDHNNVRISLRYLPKVDASPELGHQQLDAEYNFGKNLIAGSDCKACHQLDEKSVGPSFTQISEKYYNDKNAIGYLANKIITGGNGVWGEHAMNAHPQLSKEETTEMVKFILATNNKEVEERLPQAGSIVLKDHIGTGDEGRYVLTASYTDKGGAIRPLTNTNRLVLRPNKIIAGHADVIYNMDKQGNRLGRISDGAYFVLKAIDLKDVDTITYNIASLNRDAIIEIRTDGTKGKLISEMEYTATGSWNKFKELKVAVTDPGGTHDLYFIFRKKGNEGTHLASLDWIRFEGGKEAVRITREVPLKKPPLLPKKTTNEKAPVKKQASTVLSGKGLIAKNDCGVCHTIDKKTIGPAYKEIANKYKNNAATLSSLADKIIKGGSGVWGNIPMTPHPNISKKEASEMVKYILTLKK